MNYSKIIILIPLTLFASCETTTTQNDEEAIKQVIIDFQDDFNDGAFKKAEQYATEDWDHINPGGGIDRGRDAVLRTVRAVHNDFLKGVSITTDSMSVRFLEPDVAIVIAYHSIDDYTTPDGVKHVNGRQIKSYVLVKRENKWLMTLDHNTSIQQ